MVDRTEEKRERLWRRLALAVPISFLLHLLIAVLLAPKYKPVADYAVNVEVMQPAPGPPPAPPAAEEAKEEPPRAEPARTRPKKKRPKPPGEAVAVQAPVEDAGAPVASVPPAPSSPEGVDGGTGGICLQDLFGFSKPGATWLLWMSVASFRDTVFEQDIARFLATYRLGRRISEAAALTPEKEVDGLLVETDDLFDWRSYRTVVSHNLGYDAIRRALDRADGGMGPLAWSETDSGWNAESPGAFRWRLPRSGQVMVVDRPVGTVAVPDASVMGPEPWPSEVGCLTLAPTPAAEPPDAGPSASPETSDLLVREARAYLAPEAGGHWPVVLLATTEPRALGLRLRGTRLKFSVAVIRIYFTDPIRVEGQVRFQGPTDRVAALKRHFERLAAQAVDDPFLRLLGLSNLFVHVALTAEGEQMAFTAEITENQAKAGILFLTLQAEALERYLEKE